ncbi:MAG: MBL fold metallo-hydrolase [Candidatus Aminicenantes bacterium]|nr:MBL fold metallo-hydrolase [Candidatus Aminicenantes bacterium]
MNGIKETPAPSGDRVHFYTLNVGQGDSHVVHIPDREAAIVIDPGDSDVIGQLLHDKLKIKHLPLILISHFHLDHMQGLNEVIRQCCEPPVQSGRPAFKPGYIFINSHSFERTKLAGMAERLDDLADLKKEHDLKFELITAESSSSQLFSGELEALGIEGHVIYPDLFQEGHAVRKNDFNLGSVLLYLVFAGKKILYTGDLPYEGWQEVSDREDLSSDVFKVPHHGGSISAGSNPAGSGRDMKKILDRVQPRFALVSVGDKHGHPLPEVIEAIVDHESKPHVFCTRVSSRCCSSPAQMKQKIVDYYLKNLKDEKRKYMMLGSERGSMCAGTIQVMFNRGSGEIITQPSVGEHLRMVKKVFNNCQPLCYKRITRN